MKRDCVVRYKLGGRVLAVASIYRDKDNLCRRGDGTAGRKPSAQPLTVIFRTRIDG
jgi:hypothetical protein